MTPRAQGDQHEGPASRKDRAPTSLWNYAGSGSGSGASSLAGTGLVAGIFCSYGWLISTRASVPQTEMIMGPCNTVPPRIVSRNG